MVQEETCRSKNLVHEPEAVSALVLLASTTRLEYVHRQACHCLRLVDAFFPEFLGTGAEKDGREVGCLRQSFHLVSMYLLPLCPENLTDRVCKVNFCWQRLSPTAWPHTARLPANTVACPEL